MMQKNSLHSFAYISIFLLIISVIVYLNIVFQDNLNKDITRQFNRQEILLARGASLGIEKEVDHYVKNLVSFAQLPAIAGVEQSAARDQIIATMHGASPDEERQLANFQIIDKNGVLRVERGSSGRVGEDLSGTDYFKEAKKLLSGEVYITGLMHIRELNPSKRYVLISTPLFKKGKGFNGVAVLAVDVDDIAGDYVSKIRMGDKGYAWVMDSHGTLVYHPARPEMIGRNLRRADNSCFACHKSFDAEKKILGGSFGDYGVYPAPTGEDKLLSFSRARVGRESWYVCVTVPYSEVTGLIAKSMRLYSWLISIIFFTVIGASVFFMVLLKKKAVADERARHTAELEDKVRKRTGELTAEKEKLNAILSGFGVAVSLLDLDYNIHWANEVVTQGAPDALGKKCYEAYVGRTGPCPECPMPVVLKTGKLEHVEMLCRRPDNGKDQARECGHSGLLTSMVAGEEGYFQVAISPIKDWGGGVKQVVELIQDVSDVKKLEQHMMRSEKLAALGRISAGIAHEIGNPLTSIYSFIQILQGNKYDEFTNSTLDTIAFHINRIREILQQMSGYSRSYQMEVGPVDVNEAVKATMDLMCGHDGGMRGCALDVEYHPGRLMVMADEKWLVSVFVNLIINALDAMKDGGRLSVRAFEHRAGDNTRQAAVEVSDTGIGISPADMEKIFDPFYTTKPTGKGTGLGLAVSYSIIKDLGGEISVSSQPGKGATFTVKLPVLEVRANA